MENYIKPKDILYDFDKVLKYFTEVEKGVTAFSEGSLGADEGKKFDYGKAQCMAGLLESTINYLKAYIQNIP